MYCNARSCGKLTLSLRPSDMKRGQSMVNYTFLFIKFIFLEFWENRGAVCEKRLTFLYTSPCEYVQYNVWGPWVR